MEEHFLRWLALVPLYRTQGGAELWRRGTWHHTGRGRRGGLAYMATTSRVPYMVVTSTVAYMVMTSIVPYMVTISMVAHMVTGTVRWLHRGTMDAHG
ncbi:unnamed protein product [Boreogadus saida]